MAWFRCGGGEVQQASGGSIILAPNPTVTLTKTSNNSVTITWAKPSSEVTIAKYQVYKYKSTTAPTSLSQMTLVGSTTNLTYSVENLDVPSTYFFVVTTVTSDDYENASVKSRQSIAFSNRGFVMKANNGIFASSDLINWTNVTDRVGNSSTVINISYAEDEGLFYTNGNVYVSEDGYDWTYKKLPDVVVPDGKTSFATSIGVRKHDYKPLLGIAAPGGTTFFTGGINEDWHETGASASPDSDLWWVYGNPKYFTTKNYGNSTLQDGATVYGYPRGMYSHENSGGYVEYIVCQDTYASGLYVYKRVVKESSDFSQAYSRHTGSGADTFYDFAVSPKNEKDKDILVISIITGLIYSVDSGKNWNYKSDIMKASKLTYDSAEDKFIALYSNGSKSEIYECDATKEALSSNAWQKISVSSDVLTALGNVVYIIGK